MKPYLLSLRRTRGAFNWTELVITDAFNAYHARAKGARLAVYWNARLDGVEECVRCR